MLVNKQFLCKRLAKYTVQSIHLQYKTLEFTVKMSNAMCIKIERYGNKRKKDRGEENRKKASEFGGFCHYDG